MAKSREEGRIRRKYSIRKRIRGSEERPRLAVFRSHKHIYAQLIDDDSGRTLVAASTLSPEMRHQATKGGNCEGAAEVGKLVAAKAQAAGITSVVFDRGGYRYHGRVKALADSAREGGLEF